VQLPLVQAKIDRVPEEARLTMRNDGLERRRIHCRFRDHLLERCAPIIRAAELNILHGDRIAIARTPLAHLPQLIGNRQVFLGLPDGRYPRIERNRHAQSSWPIVDKRCNSFMISGSNEPSKQNSLNRTGSSAASS